MFYGEVQGNRFAEPRFGSNGIYTVAASWQGSVHTRLYYDGATGRDMALVTLEPLRGQGTSRVLYEGPVSGQTP